MKISKIKEEVKKHKFLYTALKPLCKYPIAFYRKIKQYYKSSESKSRLYKDNCINNKIGKVHSLSISDLYYLYIKNGELCRFDIIVRLLAVENFFGKNNYGFAFYNKMQNSRIVYTGGGYSVVAEPKFRALIASYDKNGYDGSSQIILDKNLDLIDGSHRISLAIYYGIKSINACIMDFEKFSDYSIDWFYCNGFTHEEIELIRSKESEVRRFLVPHISILLWSPAVQFKNEIIKDIEPWGKFCGEKYFSYEKQGVFQNKVKAIYACDDIDSWKVEKKLEYMKNYGSEFIYIDFALWNPCYRVKGISNLPISVTGERLKNIIRTKYKARLKEYFYDILVHTSDNAYQADYIHAVCNSHINAADFISIMNDYVYAIVKTDVPYYPADFPADFPVGKDIDVIVAKDDFAQLKERLYAFCSEHYARDYELSLTEEEYRFRIRIEKNNLLLLQDDISYSSEYSSDFFADALTERVKQGSYYILKPVHEYIVRMAEYSKNTRKTWHLDYLKEHLSDYDEALALRYLGMRLSDIVKESDFEANNKMVCKGGAVPL